MMLLYLSEIFNVYPFAINGFNAESFIVTEVFSASDGKSSHLSILIVVGAFYSLPPYPKTGCGYFEYLLTKAMSVRVGKIVTSLGRISIQSIGVSKCKAAVIFIVQSLTVCLTCILYHILLYRILLVLAMW